MLKLNTNRQFTIPVPVTYVAEDGIEQDAQFRATFRMPGLDKEKEENQGKLLLDVVLVEVHDLELTDSEDQVLQGDMLRKACLLDHTLSTALMNAYWEAAAKKPRQATS